MTTWASLIGKPFFAISRWKIDGGWSQNWRTNKRSRWAFELKHDGYRFIARRDGDRVRVFSRNAKDWTDRVPLIVEAMRGLPVKSATLDGEGVVRCHRNKIGIMVDANLNWWRLGELRKWAARKISFVVIDSDTGEDITRILLA